MLETSGGRFFFQGARKATLALAASISEGGGLRFWVLLGLKEEGLLIQGLQWCPLACFGVGLFSLLWL